MATGARVREVVQEGARRLSEAGIANARHEVEWPQPAASRARSR